MMSQNQQQPPFQQQPIQPGAHHPQPPKPPKKPRKWLPYVIGAGGFVLGLVVGAAPSSSTTDTTSSPATTVTVTAPAPAAKTTAPPPPPATTQAPKATAPTVKDFKLTVKTLTKQCFGSAGCNVTFRILVAYSGPELDPSKTYEVLYEVRGGEDGPIANKLTVQGGESSVDEEEMVSTAKSSAKLTAVVTDVMES